MILSKNTPEERAKIIEKFVTVGKVFCFLNFINFIALLLAKNYFFA